MIISPARLIAITLIRLPLKIGIYNVVHRPSNIIRLYRTLDASTAIPTTPPSTVLCENN